jgi:hypothetical protein
VQPQTDGYGVCRNVFQGCTLPPAKERSSCYTTHFGVFENGASRRYIFEVGEQGRRVEHGREGEPPAGSRRGRREGVTLPTTLCNG